MNKTRKKLRWKDLSLAVKVLIQVIIVAVILFGTNTLLYWQMNRTMQTLDAVYASNVDITELAQSLEKVQIGMYDYLTVKSSDTLEDYYRYEENYRKLLEKLNEQVMENPVKLLERNIRTIWLIRQRQYRQSVGGMWRSIRTLMGKPCRYIII